MIDFDYNEDKIKAPNTGALLLEVPTLRTVLLGVCLGLRQATDRDFNAHGFRTSADDKKTVIAFSEIMSEHKASYKEDSTITENNT